MKENWKSIHLSNNDVAEKATEILKRIQKEVLARPQSTDLRRISRYVKEDSDLAYTFVIEDLGTKSGAKILGQTRFIRREIAIDKSFTNEKTARLFRLPFVVAHELGHAILHTPVFETLVEKGVLTQELSDTYDTISGKKVFKSEKDFVERQANVFAVNLLVPEYMFRQALVDHQKMEGIHRNIGHIHYSVRNRGSFPQYMKAIKHLATVFKVSHTLVKYRLEELNMVTDYDKRFTPIGAVLLEEFDFLELVDRP